MTAWLRLVRFVKTYSTGVVAAGVSVSFATYMLLTGGGGNLPGPDVQMVVRHVPVESPLKERPEVAIVPSRSIMGGPPLAGEDMLITGSVRKASPEKRAAASSGRDRRPGNGGVPHYVVRFATRDVALVEGAGRLWSVEPGDILPGAGRIVGIERRGRDRWVLKAYDGRTMREIGSR